MKISLNWLKQYIKLTQSPEEVAALLTGTGLEVESVSTHESVPGGLVGVVIGKVLECAPHPNADKLKQTKVDVGDEVLPIVCGAPNVAAGQTVVVAKVGATLHFSDGNVINIKKAKIRGEVSQGMICAEDELGLGESHEGIMVLQEEVKPGTAAASYFKLENDTVLEIGLTPNRVDAASHIGVARDLKAALGNEIQWPELAKLDGVSNETPLEIDIRDTEACPRYSGLVMTGVKVGPSPEWLQKRLKSIGLNPINNVVDVTNFIMHEMGQPLHAFDVNKIRGGKIIVDTASDEEKFTTLDEVERKLSTTDLTIRDAEGTMAIAGVFGGMNSGVSSTTTSIFIESAYFSPSSIRKTAQRHGLKTDASFRYERGADPEITIVALQRAAFLLQHVAGASIGSKVYDHYPNPKPLRQILFKFATADKLIGKVLDREEIQQTLERLDFKITYKNEAGLVLDVPSYRVEVEQQADVVEELLRIHGYDNIELSAQLGAKSLAEFPVQDQDKLKGTIASLLASNGFFEIMTNSLTSPKYTKWLGEGAEDTEVKMLNPLSEDLSVMRQSMVFTALEVLAHNINRRQSDLRLFEFGKVYSKRGEKYSEGWRLSLFMTGQEQAESWRQKGTAVDFHSLGGHVGQIMQRLGISGVGEERFSDSRFEFGIILSQGNKELGRIGKLKGKMLRSFELKQEVFCAELDWDLLSKRHKGALTVNEISKFPEVRRDLSLVLDRNISYAEIKKVAMQTERKLLQSINAFDVYEGDKIAAGKKAVAISFILQDANGTLSDKVIDKTMDRLMERFEKELGAEIRR